MHAPLCRVQNLQGVHVVGWIPPSVLRTILPGHEIRDSADICLYTTNLENDDALDPNKVNLLVSVFDDRQDYLDSPYGQRYGERQSYKITFAFLNHLDTCTPRGLFGGCDLFPMRTPPASFFDMAMAAKGVHFLHGAHYHAPYLRRRAANGDWGITSPSTTAFYSVFDAPKPLSSADHHVFFCGEPHRIIPPWANVWIDCKLIPGSPAIYEPFWLTSMTERVNHTVEDINLPRGVKTKGQFCAFMYRNCVSWREALFFALSRYKTVDALGLSPRRVTGGVSKGNRVSASFMDDAVEMYRDYRFVICCENSKIDGYITEKIINARLAGCIPIYLGSPDWTKYVNPEAVVDASRSDFVQVVKQIDRSPALQRRMLSVPLIRPEILEQFNK